MTSELKVFKSTVMKSAINIKKDFYAKTVLYNVIFYQILMLLK